MHLYELETSICNLFKKDYNKWKTRNKVEEVTKKVEAVTKKDPKKVEAGKKRL